MSLSIPITIAAHNGPNKFCSLPHVLHSKVVQFLDCGYIVRLLLTCYALRQSMRLVPNAFWRHELVRIVRRAKPDHEWTFLAVARPHDDWAYFAHTLKIFRCRDCSNLFTLSYGDNENVYIRYSLGLKDVCHDCISPYVCFVRMGTANLDRIIFRHNKTLRFHHREVDNKKNDPGYFLLTSEVRESITTIDVIP
jgi:hypothetical protein